MTSGATPPAPAAARLRDLSIVHFAHGPWQDIWRDRQHIFSRLARDNGVLYVEPRQYSLADWRRGEVPAEAWQTPRLQHWRDGLWLYRHPPWAPRTDWPGLQGLMRGLRRRALLAAMRQRGFRAPITWFYQPKDAELVGTLGERLIIYQVVDEYAAFRYHSPEKQQRLRALESYWLPRADLVITSSHALLAAKAPFNPNTVLVHNGVDFDAYERVRLAQAEPPADIAGLPRPIVGYVGHVSARLNLPLLAEIARSRPAWSLVIVGSVWDRGCEADLAVLRALPNVHFLGAKAADQVPAYTYSFDVGLIPYLPGEEAQNINPIKLYEYLAAGKPVVSLELPALDGFRHLVRVAETPAGYVAALEAALGDTDPAVVANRRQVAAENTWDRRVEQISAHVSARLAGRPVRGSP